MIDVVYKDGQYNISFKPPPDLQGADNEYYANLSAIFINDISHTLNYEVQKLEKARAELAAREAAAEAARVLEADGGVTYDGHKLTVRDESILQGYSTADRIQVLSVIGLSKHNVSTGTWKCPVSPSTWADLFNQLNDIPGASVSHGQVPEIRLITVVGTVIVTPDNTVAYDVISLEFA